MPRKLLRNILSKLSKWAIKKHKIEIVLVTGPVATRLAREMIYDILSSQFRVRRLIKKRWWDLSLPLTILGYKDVQRNFFQWVGLIFRASGYLLFGPSNPHKLILNANTNNEDTIKYWLSFLTTDVLVVLEHKETSKHLSYFLNTLLPNSCVIYNPQVIDQESQKVIINYKNLTYGGDAECEVQIINSEKGVKIEYQKNNILLQQASLPLFSRGLVGAVIATALCYKIDFEEIIYNLLKFQTPSDLVAQITSNIKEIQ